RTAWRPLPSSVMVGSSGWSRRTLGLQPSLQRRRPSRSARSTGPSPPFRFSRLCGVTSRRSLPTRRSPKPLDCSGTAAGPSQCSRVVTSWDSSARLICCPSWSNPSRSNQGGTHAQALADGRRPDRPRAREPRGNRGPQPGGHRGALGARRWLLEIAWRRRASSGSVPGPALLARGRGIAERPDRGGRIGAAEDRRARDERGGPVVRERLGEVGLHAAVHRHVHATVAEERPGSTSSRGTSRGSRVRLRIAATTTGPIVMLGTKRPSITSTWSWSAPPASTRAMSWPRAAKSADRIEGAILITALLYPDPKTGGSGPP